MAREKGATDGLNEPQVIQDKRLKQSMGARVATAVFGIPVLGICMWFETLWFIVILAASAIGTYELFNMMVKSGRRPMSIISAAWAVSIVTFVQVVTMNVSVFLPIIPTGFSLLLVFWIYRYSETRPSTSDWIMALGIPICIAFLLAHALLIRSLVGGTMWVFIATGVTFVGDTAALIVGNAVGRHKMAPVISPRKTWEGAIGGWFFCIISCLIAAAFFTHHARISQFALLGGLMGVVGQCGDLLESRMKRLANVKDAGWILPGHGGLMDRLDSIVFNLPLVYYFVIWVIH